MKRTLLTVVLILATATAFAQSDVCKRRVQYAGQLGCIGITSLLKIGNIH